MKRTSSIIASLVLFAAALFAPSCNSLIYEGTGDCDVIIRFEYDFNMKYADAFPNEVKAVALYVFDQSGRFVTKATDSGPALAEKGYYMTIPGLEPGVYDLVAWCGLIDDTVFSVADPATREELFCRMKTLTKAGSYMDRDLGTLFYGYVEDADLDRLPPGSVNTVTVPLIKNTNSVRVLLQALDNITVIDPAEYEFIIRDRNAVLDWQDNVYAPSPLDYYAWDKRQGSVEYTSSERLTAAVAEFTVNRFFPWKDEAEKTWLDVIDKTTGKTVIHVPVVDYFLLVKGNYNRSLSDQEYLDRQDDYQITFFLDNRRGWSLAAGIFINGWHIVLQGSDL